MQACPRPPRLYLAGPCVFLADPNRRAVLLKDMCARAGCVGVFPTDGEPPTGTDAASAIRAANMDLLRGCDAVIANMEPFRGPGMDGGTAYEMGAGAALGKLVVGYTPDPRSYAARVAEFVPCTPCSEGLRDADGMLVEEFGEWSPDNLMMAKGIDALFPDAGAAIAYAASRLLASSS